jgi:UDP-GlcNAc3NAcA epimerase
MKVLTILGARPQFIKAGSVSREMLKHDNIKEIIIHTGQHYDSNMSDIFFTEMKIPKPTYFLGIGGKSHGAMTGQMIEKIEEVIIKEKPDLVLVYGDTNSTLAGAIVASKLNIRLAHIEAGLRSFNMNMPEEVNRILTDRISNILFCPTITAIKNLDKEGYTNLDCHIIKSGDVMQDGAVFYKDLSKKPNVEIKENYILATIHRAENTDDISRLKSIIEALNEINKQKQVILPIHPRTRNIVKEHNIDIEFTIIDPVGYLEMIWLIDNCDLIMTDSGGLQKEAFFFSKPCITLRDETEWIELIENKFNILTGADKTLILDVYNNYKFNNNFDVDLYGNGNASNLIVKELLNWSNNE